MYKIPEDVLNAVLHLIGTRTQGTFQELQSVVEALNKLEKIEDKKEGDKK